MAQSGEVQCGNMNVQGLRGVSTMHRIRVQRWLREAEGFLELKLPTQALAALDRIDNPGTFRAQMLFLRGEALRAMQQFREATDCLEKASELAPSNMQIYVSLAWCHKRTGHLELAIDTLEQALEVEPRNALLHYNLACYWSLAHHAPRAVYHLRKALDCDSSYREKIALEADFDPIRSAPEFQALAGVKV
jgi:tetratricopeptide (TPR) repeat protein